MSALALRIIACVCMLLDHIGYCCSIMPLRYIGRLAFPIYVFLMVNGFRHTGDRTRYALRFGLFAILSQVPFSLMCYNAPDGPVCNVMVTLLMGLLVIWSAEAMVQHKFLRYLCWIPAGVLYGLCLSGVIQADYGTKGILMALVFWCFGEKKVLVVLGFFLAVWNQNLAEFLLGLFRGELCGVPNTWDMIQNVSVLALPLIFLYNGKPGNLPSDPVQKKRIQLGFYAFYPVHMLILWFLF